MTPLLELDQLRISIGEKPILATVSLTIQPGERHVIMGPNGSGKSTLAQTLAGYPDYNVVGNANFNGVSILKQAPADRARAGLFVTFQQPVTIEGVKARQLLRASINAIRSAANLPPLSIHEIRTQAKKAFTQVGLPIDFLDRYVNDGFSGGEKKRFEVAQYLLLQPKLAIFDEIDSGLDIDAIHLVGSEILKSQSATTGILFITHQTTMAKILKPTHVHILAGGQIICSGGFELIDTIQDNGYAQTN